MRGLEREKTKRAKLKIHETITDEVLASRLEKTVDTRRAHARIIGTGLQDLNGRAIEFVAFVRLDHAAFLPPPTLQSSVAGAAHLSRVPSDGSRSYPFNLSEEKIMP
jgi:hypothetical protein